MATPCPLQLVYGPSAEQATPDPILNVVLPLTGKYRLNSKIQYAEDEEQYLYTEYTILFDLIVYPQIATGYINNMEQEVGRIRSILQTPGLRLNISPIGLGEFGIINYTHYDAKGGPYPQDIEVQQFTGNRAISVRGSIMFRLAPCVTNNGAGAPPADTRHLQYSVEQDLSVNEDGIVEITLHFTSQYFGPLPDLDGGPIAKTLEHNLANSLVRRLGRSFQGMKKRIRTSISRDGRTYRIRVVYTEHESDSAYFPFTRNVTLTDDLESSLLGEGKGKGFYKWRRNLDCTIKVPTRIHKAWAWYIFKVILIRRFARLKLIDKTITEDIFTRPEEQPEPFEKEKPWYIPLRVKISNEVYSRTIKFSVAYMVVCHLTSIIANTMILETVDTDDDDDPSDISDQWKAWQDTQLDIQVNGGFQYTTTGMPMTYNQCTSFSTMPTIGASTVDPIPDSSFPEPPLTVPTVTNPPTPATDATDEYVRIPYLPIGSSELEQIPPAHSWLEYDNEFTILEEGNILPISYLEEPEQPEDVSTGEEPNRSYYQAGNETAPTERNSHGLVLNNRTTPYEQDFPVETIERGHSIFYLQMKGYALRYNWKPPVPYVVSIGGKTVKRLSSRVTFKTISVGDRTAFLVAWDILHVIEGGDPYVPDIFDSTVTTGSPNYYA